MNVLLFTHKKSFIWLSVLLLIKATVFFWFLQQSVIGLGPDEAQYWTWSRSLDWGYYSKPPGIAWQIAAGTALFGNTPLGVRFMSIIMAAILSIVVFGLGVACRCTPKTCFWAGLCMALSPLGLMNSFLAITDVGVVVFWALACVVIASALSTNHPPNFYLLGLVILLGALFKWPIYFFWVLVFGLLYWHRSWINRSLFIGILISLCGLLPSVIWNMNHNWVTFRHVGSTLLGGSENIARSVSKGNFLDFIGAQILLVSPIFFALLVLAYFKSLKKDTRPPQALFVSSLTCLIPLVGFSLYSLFRKTQGNWCDYIYSGGFVLFAWYACEKMKHGMKWLFGGALLSVVLTLFTFGLPYLQSNNLLNLISIPYKTNPFKQNVGWDKLAEVLHSVGYDSNKHFLFSDRYQGTSILSFYSPNQKRAYFFNLGGIRFNQFSFWPSMAEEHRGKDGYFVVFENNPLHENNPKALKDYQQKLKSYFQNVSYLGPQPLFWAYDKPVKFAYIFFCQNYNGALPLDSNLY